MSLLGQAVLGETVLGGLDEPEEPYVPVTYDYTLSDSLTLGDVVEDATNLIEADFTDSLAFNQTLSIEQTHNFSFTDHLPITDEAMYEGINVTVPTTVIIIPTELEGKQWFQLSSGGDIVYLPAPEWNDSEGLIDQLSVKRAMTGLPYPYRKRTSLRALSYDFILTRPKALELKTFLKAHLSNAITIVNHKSEQWIAVVTINPSEIVEEREYKNLVKLDFEGIRL
jgi:hypothetical protein